MQSLWEVLPTEDVPREGSKEKKRGRGDAGSDCHHLFLVQGGLPQQERMLQRAEDGGEESLFSFKGRLKEPCDRGALKELLVPPSWVLRLATPRKRHKRSQAQAGKHKSKVLFFLHPQLSQQSRSFIVKPMETVWPGPAQPLIVFVNPKSGGNKVLLPLPSLPLLRERRRCTLSAGCSTLVKSSTSQP